MKMNMTYYVIDEEVYPTFVSLPFSNIDEAVQVMQRRAKQHYPVCVKSKPNIKIVVEFPDRRKFE